MKWPVLYWVGEHAVILDDVTVYGLVRRHILRRGALPDLDQFLRNAPERAGYQVYVDEDGFGHLWIYWKDVSLARKVTEWADF